MQLYQYELESKEAASLATEIQYAIAAAKATAQEIVRLHFSEDVKDTVYSVLKKVKKSHKISFFVGLADFESESTVSRYTVNKFPNLEIGKDITENSVLVKI